MHCAELCYIALHCIALYYIVSYRIVSYRIVSYGRSALDGMVWHGIVSYSYRIAEIVDNSGDDILLVACTR